MFDRLFQTTASSEVLVFALAIIAAIQTVALAFLAYRAGVNKDEPDKP